MRLLAWHHSSLAVADLEAAVRFYREAFGFQVAFREDGMSDQIASMTGLAGLTCDLAQLRHPASGHVLELICFHGGSEVAAPDPRPLRPGAAHVAFFVDDLEAALARVEALGARRLGQITRFSDGLSVYCREPAGSFFEIEQPFET